MKMSLTRARALLSITEEDDLASLKKKYHRLMSACHPDALGSDRPEHLRRAQEINEAYRLLKEDPQAFTAGAAVYRREEQPAWSGELNEWAFRERNIYLYYSLEVEEILPYYRAARGKYLWDPDEEEFPLFLISIHKLVKDLCEEADADVAAQSRLFHYLAEQFIDPVTVLRKIARPEKRDAENREIYHFPAYLKTDRRHPLPEGMVLYPKTFQENRILVRDVNGTEYGHLSFEDDRLYFCMIPLLKSKLAKVKMRTRRGRVDFYFRLEPEVENYRIPNRNLQIARLLTRD